MLFFFKVIVRSAVQALRQIDPLMIVFLKAHSNVNIPILKTSQIVQFLYFREVGLISEFCDRLSKISQRVLP